jgi:hypothetical protein
MSRPASSPALAAQCTICGTLLSGALARVFRVAGIKRSPRNPNICSRCDTHVEEGRLVEMTVVFADLSSFTELTHELGAQRTHEVVDAFLRAASGITSPGTAALSTNTSATRSWRYSTCRSITTTTRAAPPSYWEPPF